MAQESIFNADDLDLDAVLLAGFGLTETEAQQEAQQRELTLLTGGAEHEQPHTRLTHRVGQVGRLQVTFAYHGDHQHQ